MRVVIDYPAIGAWLCPKGGWLLSRCHVVDFEGLLAAVVPFPTLETLLFTLDPFAVEQGPDILQAAIWNTEGRGELFQQLSLKVDAIEVLRQGGTIE